MMIYFSLFLVGIFFGVAGCSKTSKGNLAAQQAALEAAKDWLALVDSQQYSESWEQAAGYFKNVVSQNSWERTSKAVRDPLGALVSRELKSRQYTTSVPGAPDGQYVVIQFTTSFENKKSAIETVTPMLDKDGRWRVSGYYIK